jgi:TRAP-type mannitol/chloroaromatic compound transport system substrate-binding protein
MTLKRFIKKLTMSITVAGALLTPFMANAAKAEYKWKMVTTWPKNFPGLGTGANELAKLITEMSNGRISVKVYGAKELVGALETFDAVSRGTAELGHGAAITGKAKFPRVNFSRLFRLV